MSCRAVTRLLPLYVGGDLSARDAATVESHLGACDACRAGLARYEESRQSLFRLKGSPDGPAPDLWGEVRRRLPARPARVRRIPLTAAAAILVLAAGALAWTALSPRPDGPVEAPPTERAAEPAEESGGGDPAALPVRAGAGVSEFLLVEVGPAAAPRAFESIPSVRPAEADRKTWDEF